MSRLVDATLCPDCRATLDAVGHVPGLRPAAHRLRSPPSCGALMVDADRIVEQLRTLSGRGTGPRCQRHRRLPRSPVVPAPRHPRRHAARRLPAASVPVVLLSLGALCLLVAAVVFVAVTWSLLGLTGRTLVLLGITGLPWPSSRSCSPARTCAEPPRRSGWSSRACSPSTCSGLSPPDSPVSTRWTGAAPAPWSAASLLALGLGVAAWARGQPVGRLYGAEAVAVVGALVVCATQRLDRREPGRRVHDRRPGAGRAVRGASSRCSPWRRTAWVGWRSPQLAGAARRGLGPGPRDGRPRRVVVRPARLAAAGRGRSSRPSVVHLPEACPTRSGRSPPALALLAWSCWPRRRRPRHRRDPLGRRDGSAVLLALGLVAAFAARAPGPSAPPRSPALGVLGLGPAARRRPWDVLAGARPRRLERRRPAPRRTSATGAAAWT